jgi:hypothetical protein
MTCYPITARIIPNVRPCHRISAAAQAMPLASYAKEALMKFAPLTIAALFVALPALALEPINKEAHINNSLLQGFIGDQIADNCPTIEARTLRALGELNKLKNYALSKGYSAAEIRAFVKDKNEKARGKAEAAAWLKAKGAVPGKPEAYCAVGEAEIAKGSLIGYLLRSKK